jgi:hypothetical protein
MFGFNSKTTPACLALKGSVDVNVNVDDIFEQSLAPCYFFFVFYSWSCLVEFLFRTILTHRFKFDQVCKEEY